ncbi:hypothetical protein D9V34_00055 [Mycetocola lacteus]|uniref:Secreted protein n=1 Tax=Mycetocola lacteus TaxID=76637 RepID=A0A3L7AMF9_9MICO|nr:hypothetical protein [Mycetocola lacteus]RLP80658.1 hypothetical protein D9V34_12350 [Mycetocola lacteus]RLP84443.1 hypothetical protein D9V34_00055 [Mycetocola lacteus]
MKTIPFTRKTRLAAALAVIPLSIALLAGCSAGSSGNSPSPEAGGDSKPAAGNGGGTTDQQYQEWVLKFNGCMEKLGHDMPEPGQAMQGLEEGPELDAYLADSEKCMKEVGEAPGANKKSKEEVNEAALKFSQCLRDNGIDVPDSDRPNAITVPQNADKAVLDKCNKEAGIGAN